MKEFESLSLKSSGCIVLHKTLFVVLLLTYVSLK